jgi:hypothetical protein
VSIVYPLTCPVTANKTRIGYQKAAGRAESPFSGISQVFEWSRETWNLSMSFPPLKNADARNMAAFLLAMRGMVGTFLAGDPFGKAPAGVGTGTPLVSGLNQSRSKLLMTKGWTPSTSGILLPGDYIQVPRNLIQSHFDLTSSSWTDDAGVTTSIAGTAPDGVSAATDVGFPAKSANTSFGIWQVVTPRDVVNQVIASIYLYNNDFGHPLTAKSVELTIQDYPFTQTLGTAIVSIAYNQGWQQAAFTITPPTNCNPQIEFIVRPPYASATSAYGIRMWGAELQQPSTDVNLHRVLTQANSDSSGNATLDVFPILRTPHTHGVPIVTSNPKGLWRLTDNKPSWDIEWYMTHAFSLSAEEVV